MKLLFWFRALWGFNFCSWNNYHHDFSLACELKDLSCFNIGQKFEVTSVNRTTGRVTMKDG
jgi:hypothetical protein